MADADQKPRIIDNPDVPEIFANKTIGILAYLLLEAS